MLPLDGELFDAAEDTGIIEKTNRANPIHRALARVIRAR
jgi:hypothetical protein